MTKHSLTSGWAAAARATELYTAIKHYNSIMIRQNEEIETVERVAYRYRTVRQTARVAKRTKVNNNKKKQRTRTRSESLHRGRRSDSFPERKKQKKLLLIGKKPWPRKPHAKKNLTSKKQKTKNSRDPSYAFQDEKTRKSHTHIYTSTHTYPNTPRHPTHDLHHTQGSRRICPWTKPYIPEHLLKGSAQTEPPPQPRPRHERVRPGLTTYPGPPNLSAENCLVAPERATPAAPTSPLRPPRPPHYPPDRKRLPQMPTPPPHPARRISEKFQSPRR